MEKLRFFTVCPFHTDSFGMGVAQASDVYMQNVQEHARWADEHGLYGMVIYNFHTSLDPLLTAQLVLSTTRQIRPMVAVQPAYMHPFALARAMATLAYIYRRGVDLNVVAGASPLDMRKIGDTLEGEERHERLREYVSAIRSLSKGTTTLQGRYYHLEDLVVQPALSPAYQPCIYIPGSSEASCQTVQACADSSLLMAKPLAHIQEEIQRLNGDRCNLRHAMIVGVITRKTTQAAWEATSTLAHQDRRTKVTNRMFIAQTSSYQHRANLALAEQQTIFDGLLWYGSAKIGIDAPKLVGSYAEVRAALRRYAEAGITDILLDLPDDPREYDHMLQSIQSFMP